MYTLKYHFNDLQILTNIAIQSIRLRYFVQFHQRCTADGMQNIGVNSLLVSAENQTIQKKKTHEKKSEISHNFHLCIKSQAIKKDKKIMQKNAAKKSNNQSLTYLTIAARCWIISTR